MDKNFTSYRIEERSYVAYIKREIHIEVSKLNFSETKAGEIDIIVSELCSNLIKHSGGGEVIYRTANTSETDSIFEIICIDSGPGISDIAGMMKDGVSTTKTLGQGLGAIERLSNIFQIYSLPQWGTIQYACVTSKEEKFSRRKSPDLEIRGLCIPKLREIFCGDGYAIKKTETEIGILFGDGLGHGEQAHHAVKCAADAFMETQEQDPPEIIRAIHEKVRRTRGLVATVAVLDIKKNEWKICGVGNILTRMYNGIEYKNYMSYNGTVGLNLPSTLKYTSYPLEKNQHLLMCSDGIRTRLEMTKYPGIFRYDNMLLASALYKDFNRGTDDSSVFIAKVI